MKSLIRRRLNLVKVRVHLGAFRIADRMPWFLRKPVVNFLAGREVLSDFGQSEAGKTLVNGDFPMIKW